MGKNLADQVKVASYADLISRMPCPKEGSLTRKHQDY